MDFNHHGVYSSIQICGCIRPNTESILKIEDLGINRKIKKKSYSQRTISSF